MNLTLRHSALLLKSEEEATEEQVIKRFTGMITETGFVKIIENKILTELGWVNLDGLEVYK